MASISPYLTFPGNCEEAFNFYRSVFGGAFQYLGRFKDMPSQHPIPENEKDKVMHVSLPIGSGAILFGSDSFDTTEHAINMGNNFSISVNAESEEEAKRIFNGLSTGGKVTMAMEKTFWGALFGMFTDKFGVQWMVNYDYPQE